MKRSNGEGSYGKRMIKGYQYYYYKSPDGKFTYAKTQKALKEKIASQPKEPKKKKENISTITFGEYMLDWLKLTKEKSVEQSTYDGYEGLIINMVINYKHYDIGTMQLQNLSMESIQKYLNSLADYYSRATIKKLWVIFSQCIKYGQLKGAIPYGITELVKLPSEAHVSVKKKKVPFLTKDQANTLYDVLKKKPQGRGYVGYANNNNAHALILILYTGMRVGEMIALKWKNVDLKEGYITVSESTVQIKNRKGGDNKYILVDKTPKTEDSNRRIPLPPRAIEMIKYFKKANLLNNENDYVCQTETGTQMDKTNLNRTLKAMLKNTDLPQDASVHSLRHAYGSILLDQGVDIKKVSELLGHRDITTTYNIYIGVTDEGKKEAVLMAFSE